jgi:hypothetical protein
VAFQDLRTGGHGALEGVERRVPWLIDSVTSMNTVLPLPMALRR